jgi:hypothetical protein
MQETVPAEYARMIAKILDRELRISELTDATNAGGPGVYIFRWGEPETAPAPAAIDAQCTDITPAPDKIDNDSSTNIKSNNDSE